MSLPYEINILFQKSYFLHHFNKNQAVFFKLNPQRATSVARNVLHIKWKSPVMSTSVIFFFVPPQHAYKSDINIEMNTARKKTSHKNTFVQWSIEKEWRHISKTDSFFILPSIHNFIHHVWFFLPLPCAPFVCTRNVDWRDLYGDYGTFEIYLCKNSFNNRFSDEKVILDSTTCIQLLLFSILFPIKFHSRHFKHRRLCTMMDGFSIRKHRRIVHVK